MEGSLWPSVSIVFVLEFGVASGGGLDGMVWMP